MNVQTFPAAEAERLAPSIRELPVATRISLRVGADDLAAVGDAIGLALSDRIGTRVASGARSALCLGPDEWVLVTSEADGAEMSAALAGIAARLPLSAVDVSDREFTYQLEGRNVLDLLATGCPLDLSRLPVGNGTRTIFDTVQIVLTRETEDRFHLTVWRSFAPHVRALLDLANRELATGL
jgi:sarcosine oxidase, subunit gamma